MRIHDTAGLFALLDEVVARSARGDVTSGDADGWWHEMLTRPGHPLGTDLPDEPLLDWIERGLLDLDGARVLDIGCGNGRNSAFFARQGAEVIGLDIAATLLGEVRPRMPEGVTLRAADVLRDELPEGRFDVVYDSGCFHHLAPHRRLTYLERVLPLVGGVFGIVTLSGEAMPGTTDLDVLHTGDTAGGLPFTCAELRATFAPPLHLVEARPTRPGRDDAFALDVLNCALFRR